MMQYLNAELLKFKRTFTKKLVFIAPVVLLFLTWFLAIIWFQINAFNWWYALLLPGYITLISVLSDQKESKKLHYRAVLALPVSLKKVWIAKVLTLVLYVTLSCMILLAGILLGGFLIPNPISIDRACLGMILVVVTAIWQIPLCLFLSRKIGMLGTILINICVGLALGFWLVSKSFWWICPYSWTIRIMTPVLGILPNGTLAKSGDLLLNPSSIPIGISLSLLLFVILTISTAYWFQNQEVE